VRALPPGRTRDAQRGATRARRTWGCALACSSLLVAGAVPRLPARAPRGHGAGLGQPTRRLCVRPRYRIGYEVFNETQPFARAVSASIAATARRLRCVTLLEATDNLDGATAVANVRSMLRAGIDGLVDFQVVPAAQKVIAGLVSRARVPAVSAGLRLGARPFVSLDDRHAGFVAGEALGRAARAAGIVSGARQALADLGPADVRLLATDGLEREAFAAAARALRRVPPHAVLLLSGINDEVVAGMYAATLARRGGRLLAESIGGDALGLSQVCARPDYVGAVSFEPGAWGRWLLSAVLDLANGAALPSTLYVPVRQVTRANLRCR
jgi:DNA-binding LacI/PurR family transcriptional regulator